MKFTYEVNDESISLEKRGDRYVIEDEDFNKFVLTERMLDELGKMIMKFQALSFAEEHNRMQERLSSNSKVALCAS